MKAKHVFNFLLLLYLGFMCSKANAQEAIINLYDGPAPGSENWTQKEYRYEYQSPIWHEKNVALFNVVEPTLTVFLPDPQKANGLAMIVCPGGGFTALSWDNEGPNVAKKLAEQGITAFVLKYRIGYSGGTPEEINLIARTSYGGEGRTPESRELTEKNNEITRTMCANYSKNSAGEIDMNNSFANSLGNIPKMAGDDGRRAIEFVRKNAGKWNIKTDKIGMIGFSAGGMLTLDVAFNHNEQSKPNVIGIIYGAFGDNGVPKDPMPMFMAFDQNAATGGGAAQYASWCKARLPAEIHSFTGANHGFGYRNNGDSVNIWIDLFYNFLKKTGFIN